MSLAPLDRRSVALGLIFGAPSLALAKGKAGGAPLSGGKDEDKQALLAAVEVDLAPFPCIHLAPKEPATHRLCTLYRSNGIRQPADSYDGIRGIGHSFTRAQGQGPLEVGGAGGDSLEASLYEGDDAKDV